MNNSNTEKARILIVDDEPLIRDILFEVLSPKYECSTSDSAEQALELLRQAGFNLVLSDIEMGAGMSGLQLVPQILKSAPETVVMVISGVRHIESAIEAMQGGAFDYIQKPFEFEQIEMAVERALKHQRLLSEKRLYENHLEELVKQRTEQLRYLNYHDALTHLPNLVLFEDRLTQSLLMPQRGDSKLAVILLSIDRFRKTQNALGREIGLSILQEVAERLKKCAGEGETLARFEGDEFAILLPQISDSEHVIEVVNQIRECLLPPLSINDHQIFISASAGISFFPTDGEDSPALLKNARIALSRAEEIGGNSYQFHAAEMNSQAVRRLELENQLRQALERDEFEVFYQPKIDLTTKRIVGMEALIRWNHPNLGLISPAEFIPLAEDTGLIIPLGEWVLRTACAQTQRWQEQGYAQRVSVNLSARQLQQNLLDTVWRIIRETSLDPAYLELEVTESSIMKSPEQSILILEELKNIGIKISIDDFGTGYSSLGYLRKLPIDTLKIDKSFISEMTTNLDDATLVRAIITLSHNLRLKVIAEGVETEEQLRFLQLAQCDEMQGYLFSKPISTEAFGKMLESEVK